MQNISVAHDFSTNEWRINMKKIACAFLVSLLF